MSIGRFTRCIQPERIDLNLLSMRCIIFIDHSMFKFLPENIDIIPVLIQNRLSVNFSFFNLKFSKFYFPLFSVYISGFMTIHFFIIIKKYKLHLE